MYLQKVISKKLLLASCRSLTKIAGSGCGVGSGSVSLRYRYGYRIRIRTTKMFEIRSTADYSGKVNAMMITVVIFPYQGRTRLF